MISRGIWDTKADVWVHVHPRIMMAFWYWVPEARQYITDLKPEETDGYSKDVSKTLSGLGYLIPKCAWFVKAVPFPSQMRGKTNWSDKELTDREVGLHGEPIGRALIERGYLNLIPYKVVELRAREDQFASKDCSVTAELRPLSVEIKTEVVLSGFLFVQKAEGGHKPTMSRRDGAVVHHDIGMPAFGGLEP